MNRTAIFSFFLWVCLFSANLLAATNTAQLYEAEIPVSDEGGIEQRNALQAAFREVLVRVSGNRETPSLLSVEGIMEKVTPYVQQYRYDIREQQDPASGELVKGKVLWVRFDAAAINRILHEHGLPVWGAQRPLTLVWVAIDDGKQRYLADSDTIQTKFSELSHHAGQRGMPLLFPLLDLEDQGKLNATDLWGGFQENIMRASQRYQPEAVLTARILRQRSGGWQGHWSLYMDNAPALYWTTQGTNTGELAVAAIDNLSDSLAQRFAHARSLEQGNVSHITVQGISSLEHYAQVERHLKSLTPVTSVHVEYVEPDKVTYKLELNNNRDVLLQAIRLGKMLHPAALENNTSVSVAVDTGVVEKLFYRYVP